MTNLVINVECVLLRKLGVNVLLILDKYVDLSLRHLKLENL